VKWSRWLTWLGIIIALAGVVIGIWLQVVLRSFPFDRVEQRLSYAALGFSMIGAGALLAVAAQIMGMMQTTRAQSPN
jgi:hypothetical protein